jgi:hypothetical protein
MYPCASFFKWGGRQHASPSHIPLCRALPQLVFDVELARVSRGGNAAPALHPPAPTNRRASLAVGAAAPVLASTGELKPVPPTFLRQFNPSLALNRALNLLFQGMAAVRARMATLIAAMPLATASLATWDKGSDKKKTAASFAQVRPHVVHPFRLA